MCVFLPIPRLSNNVNTLGWLWQKPSPTKSATVPQGWWSSRRQELCDQRLSEYADQHRHKEVQMSEFWLPTLEGDGIRCKSHFTIPLQLEFIDAFAVIISAYNFWQPTRDCESRQGRHEPAIAKDSLLGYQGETGAFSDQNSKHTVASLYWCPTPSLTSTLISSGVWPLHRGTSSGCKSSSRSPGGTSISKSSRLAGEKALTVRPALKNWPGFFHSAHKVVKPLKGCLRMECDHVPVMVVFPLEKSKHWIDLHRGEKSKMHALFSRRFLKIEVCFQLPPPP